MPTAQDRIALMGDPGGWRPMLVARRRQVPRYHLRMTTYVLGAGASFHAGYPLCSELWPRVVTWAIETGSEYRRAIEVVTALNGPVLDVEGFFTDLDQGRGAFRALTEDKRRCLRATIRSCVTAYFTSISKQGRGAPLYEALSNRAEKGDVIVTFNYDVSLENELIRAQKFRVRNCYCGIEADWDEPDSEVTVLKPHGSINWIGRLFRGATHGSSHVRNAYGDWPFVDNKDSVLSGYPSDVLDKTFGRGGVAGGSDPGFVTLILPTYEKRFSAVTPLGNEWIAFYEKIWSDAAQSLERSDRIVVIGYSMPDADHHSRAVLLWNTNKRAEVFLFCRSDNERLQAQFRNHGFWRVRDMGSFEDFVSCLPAW
jgi:hypothetical protein